MSSIKLASEGSLGVAEGQPFVAPFRGASAAWAEVEQARSRSVPVRLWQPARLCGYGNLDHRTRGRARLGDVIDYIASRQEMFEDEDDEDVSVWAPALEISPELLTLVPAPVDLPRPLSTQLWIGGRGQITTLHEDPWPNYNFQLRGEKRFTLFHPADAPHLYRCQGTERQGGEFEVDALRPDLDRYPGFVHATPLTRIVREGEMIFIPPHWPHQVEYLSALTANINHWGSSQALADHSTRA